MVNEYGNHPVRLRDVVIPPLWGWLLQHTLFENTNQLALKMTGETVATSSGMVWWFRLTMEQLSSLHIFHSPAGRVIMGAELSPIQFPVFRV